MYQLPVLWTKYKGMELWKKILLALPFVVVAAFLVFYFFFEDTGTGLKNLLLKKKKEETEAIINTAKEEIKEIKKEEIKLEDEREALKEEIKENEKKANNIDTSINNADTFYELERIRQEIVRQSRED